MTAEVNTLLEELISLATHAIGFLIQAFQIGVGVEDLADIVLHDTLNGFDLLSHLRSLVHVTRLIVFCHKVFHLLLKVPAKGLDRSNKEKCRFRNLRRLELSRVCLDHLRELVNKLPCSSFGINRIVDACSINTDTFSIRQDIQLPAYGRNRLILPHTTSDRPTFSLEEVKEGILNLTPFAT